MLRPVTFALALVAASVPLTAARAGAPPATPRPGNPTNPSGGTGRPTPCLWRQQQPTSYRSP